MHKIGDTIDHDGIRYIVRSVFPASAHERRFGMVANLNLKQPSGAKWYAAQEFKGGHVVILNAERGK